jgi:predicted glycoside hydrolase/deacetylase ChbG (UPF0249 family)
MKNIVICADDFGYNDEVSAGIIKLLNFGTINATSCMVNLPISQNYINQLLSSVKENIDIGLHLNFTEGFAISNHKPLPSLKKILLKSHFDQLDYTKIYNEIKCQIIKFISLFNKNPDFIDGHQHVHHLPIIRKALINLYIDLGLNETFTYIRSVSNVVGDANLKTKIIKSTGANKLLRLMDKFNIPTNDNFSGIYNFKNKKPFSKIMNDTYSSIRDKGIIMCHPGQSSSRPDELKCSRPIELEYFSSQQCIDDQIRHDIHLKSGRILFRK